MADYVLARKSRNIASSAVHIFLNILLGVFAVLTTVFTGSPLIGIIMVLISKWRIFAVRRRYLLLNIKSNLVDLIVGLSIVMLAYLAPNSVETIPLVHFVLIALYVIWLLVIKPMSNESATQVQSLVAVFLGVSAIMIMSDKFKMDPIFCSLMSFLVGYAASRHVLVQADSQDFTLTTLVCGLVFAEVAWMCNMWMIVYTFGDTGIWVPQASIILAIFSFIYNYTRQAIVKYRDDFRFKNILGPVLFGLVLIGIIVLFTSDARFDTARREVVKTNIETNKKE